jgi:glucose/arabinose dehydrogenase
MLSFRHFWASLLGATFAFLIIALFVPTILMPIVRAQEFDYQTLLPAIYKPVPPASQVTLVEYVEPFPNETITIITHADDNRLFVGTQQGRVHIVDPDLSGMSGTRRTRPFLDISHLTQVSFEEGLLGLAFHPDYEQNGFIFVTYSGWRFAGQAGPLILSRFKNKANNPNEIDLSSEVQLLHVAKPFIEGQGDSKVHNAGDLHFGPDGYLYVALGDGGPDPYQVPNRPADIFSHGQRLDVLWGKILRLDIDAQSGSAPDCGVPNPVYTIPSDNPFSASMDGKCDEIWSYGWRNPWRFSFDRLTGEMFIGDVGEFTWEEVNREPRNTPGRNYGWSCFEGTRPYSPYCIHVYVFPDYQYGAGDACSVIGGYVYRGQDYPTLLGQYVFTDFCIRDIWRIPALDMAAGTTKLANGTAFPQWTTMGEDAQGELYLGSFGSGRVFKIAVP